MRSPPVAATVGQQLPLLPQPLQWEALLQAAAAVVQAAAAVVQAVVVVVQAARSMVKAADVHQAQSWSKTLSQPRGPRDRKCACSTRGLPSFAGDQRLLSRLPQASPRARRRRARPLTGRFCVAAAVEAEVAVEAVPTVKVEAAQDAVGAMQRDLSLRCPRQGARVEQVLQEVAVLMTLPHSSAASP